MTDLAKLVVRLEANSARLEKNLDQANKKLGRLSQFSTAARKSLVNMAKLGGVALTALSAVMVTMGRRTLDLADRMAKLSQQNGLAVEALSRLRYQSELTGSSFEANVKGVKAFQRAMYDAEQGLKTQSDAFARLDISVADSSGMLRDTEQVMLDVADRFSRMENGAEKAALAQILFGRAGGAMIPLLNAGRDGLEAMGDEAAQLGIVMDAKLAKAAEQVNDNMTRLRSAVEGVFIRLMSQAAPKIEVLTNKLVAWSKEANNVESSFDGIINSTVFVLDAIDGIGRAFTATANAGVAAFSALSGSMSLWANRVQKLPTVRMFFTDEDRAETKRNAELMQSVLDQSMAKLNETVNKPLTGQRLKKIWENPEQTAASIAAPAEQASKQIQRAVDSAAQKLKGFDAVYKTAMDKSESMAKSFQDRFNKIMQSNSGLGGAENTIDVGFLELKAKQALDKGDIDGAASSLNAAYDVLERLKESGSQNNLVIEGLATSLKRVGEQISDKPINDIEAKIKIDLDGAIQAAKAGNEAMQAMLDQNPLIQKFNIDTSMIPAAPTQVNGQGGLRPANINLPDGRSMEVMFNNQDDVDYWQREMSREALRRGKR